MQFGRRERIDSVLLDAVAAGVSIAGGYRDDSFIQLMMMIRSQ